MLARETGVSHTTVSHVFSATRLPAWGVVELLVEAMNGDTTTFHDMWLAASTPVDAAPLGMRRIAGRKKELTAVGRHLATSTGLLLATGEAGIGKTSLLAAAADGTSAFVAAGRCLPLSTEVPLLPLADCVRSVFETDGGAWFGEALGRCPTYVAASMAVLLPESALTDADTGRTPDRQLLFASLAAALRSLASTRELVLLLEDLHWADPGTLDLLEHLVHRGSPVAVLGSWRTGEVTTTASSLDWLNRARRMPDTVVLDLGPLSLDETIEQLQLLGVDDADRVERIHARSLGQPLFTEQLAAHVDDEPGMPDLLTELLDRRVIGLSKSAWAVMRTLAVSERPLSLELLSRVSGLRQDKVASQLRKLQGRHLVQAPAAGDVQLQHPLLAEAVQRRLVASEAVMVHRSLAEALADEAGTEAAEVAAHWLRAGDRGRELDWRVAAAHAAAARFDRGQAADQWLRVLEILSDLRPVPAHVTVTQAEAYLAAMDALRASLQWERASRMSDAAEQALVGVDERVRAELLYRAAEYRGMREGPHVAMALTDEALRLFDRHPVTEGKVRALDRKTNLLRDEGRFDESRRTLEAAVAAARVLDEPLFLRDLLMQEAWDVGVSGHPERALSMLAAAAERAGTDDDPLGDIRQAVYATDVLLVCGAGADEIARAGSEGLSVAREHGIDTLTVLTIRVNLASGLLRAGRVDDAERIIAIAADEPVDLGRWRLHALRAAVDATRGRVVPARERLSAITAGLKGLMGTDLEFLTLVASIGDQLGDPGSVLDDLVERLGLVVHSTPVRLVAPALVVAARCAADLAEDEVGREPSGHGQVLLDHARRVGLIAPSDPHDTNLAAHRTMLSAELGRLGGRDLASTWTGAAELWDLLDRRHDAAYCRWRAAATMLRQGQGSAAVRLLGRAAADARDHVPLSQAIAASRPAQ